MAAKHSIPELTAERLRELFSYNPETGLFTRLVQTSNNTRVGDVATCTNLAGYVVFRVDHKLFRAHRLAWLYMYGVWPSDQLDHINGIPNDNRISNLRECTNAENGQNLPFRKNNKSGFTGVSYSKKTNKWHAYICVSFKTVSLGGFDDPRLAHLAYMEAKSKFHKFQPTPRATF